MILRLLAGLFFFSTVALAQNVHFNYNPGTDFTQYRTYEWGGIRPPSGVSQIIDQEIKQAVDAQLAQRGLQRVDDGGDLRVVYQTSGDPGWHWNTWKMGLLPWHEAGETSVELYDQARQQLVWLGRMSMAPNPSENPEQGYARLQRAITKLFTMYPPAVHFQEGHPIARR